MKDWIIGVLFVITFIFLIIFSYIYNWYKLKKEINKIINKNLLKLGKNNYQFSDENYSLIFSKIKIIEVF
ncbi:MAG: hypothetical protein H9Q67_06630 [Spiroplasma ixodetis]|nr:hypothetical protein [Spiroplasma ixodetis]